MWPDSRIQELLKIDLPILLAPMAGAALSDLAIGVAQAGGLGSVACAMLSAEQIHAEVANFRAQSRHPINLNFFCHRAPEPDVEREAIWRTRLADYYAELGLDLASKSAGASRMPFNDDACRVVVALRPEVVSFHFGLPEENLLARVKAAGAKILGCATTVEEARWLEQRGCDAIIAQGYEAGGHRGMFLARDISTQPGTMALVPQVVDAVKIPVIAAGGIGDGRGIAAAFALGAAAVQLGTAYLLCPEARISPVHLHALQNAKDNATALTNIFSGRPARGILNRFMREMGPMSDLAPEFPLASAAVAPLRQKSEVAGSADFAQMWSGQAAALARELPAGELTTRLAAETLAIFAALSRSSFARPL